MRDVGTPADRDHSSSGSASTSAQAKKPASTNAEEPSSPTRGGQQQDSRRLRTLSDPELDLLITLKDLAMVCTENASLAVLGHDYDLPTLRALALRVTLSLRESDPRRQWVPMEKGSRRRLGGSARKVERKEHRRVKDSSEQA
ncbi:uncharacterized protein [Oryza sativa Japonica Group]|uniref:uncharacterized protein isoform X2 n=1 Tax=Oryza sativa subsp. japonica TaxID=39947 RepID=UPI000E1B85D9|nr:uncharacterized protein LOC4342147 isoform X2 [Oryza sativa Japonica Group]XP_052159174.1 uncharacterized protein LOC127776696 isoform X3 [Oryza glaberrima]